MAAFVDPSSRRGEARVYEERRSRVKMRSMVVLVEMVVLCVMMEMVVSRVMTVLRRIQEKVFSGALSGKTLIETHVHYVSILVSFLKYMD